MSYLGKLMRLDDKIWGKIHYQCKNNGFCSEQPLQIWFRIDLSLRSDRFRSQNIDWNPWTFRPALNLNNAVLDNVLGFPI